MPLMDGALLRLPENLRHPTLVEQKDQSQARRQKFRQINSAGLADGGFFEVPAGTIWRVLCIDTFVKADATVADRRIWLNVLTVDPDFPNIWRMEGPLFKAGEGCAVEVFPGASDFDGQDLVSVRSFPDVDLLPGWHIQYGCDGSSGLNDLGSIQL